MVMKFHYYLLIFFTLGSLSSSGQGSYHFPHSSEMEQHIRFLASDELMGRETGEMGNLVAARYIAETFRKYGLKSIDSNDYLQWVPLYKSVSAKEGTLLMDTFIIEQNKNAVFLSGDASTLEAPVVFLNYAWKGETMNDFEGVDVNGKIVIALLGSPENIGSVRTALKESEKKKKWVAEEGGICLLELYTGKYPWNLMLRYLSGDRVRSDSGDDTPNIIHGLLNVDIKGLTDYLSLNSNALAQLKFSGVDRKNIRSANVIGVIEGSDPMLKNEFVVLSAHYDHVGSGVRSDVPATRIDSIYNGARDNGMGVTAMLSAAKALSLQKPRRSILCIGYTGEELGLLGSKYFAENPLLDLKDIVFNLNTDGAGYNDVTKVTVIGHERTTSLSAMESAATYFGLTLNGDPAPEQNLFDRSDNVSLAEKGIPAASFGPGFTAFDEQITKYYHQPSDQIDNLDMDYLFKFCWAYALAARNIANQSDRPKWIVGDKYEAAFKELYMK